MTAAGPPSDPAAAVAALAPEPQLGDRVRFVVELDRLQPLLLNHASAGQAWREHGITAEQVRAVNATIREGSPALWTLAQRIIDDAVAQGWLPEHGR